MSVDSKKEFYSELDYPASSVNRQMDNGKFHNRTRQENPEGA
jgi:hypothetical protein